MLINRRNEVTTEIQGFPKDFDFNTARNLTTQGIPQTVDNKYSPDDKLLSFFTRVEYNFMDRVDHHRGGHDHRGRHRPAWIEAAGPPILGGCLTRCCPT
jgi:hypothetical protein